MSTIADNIARVQDEIFSACARSGRSHEDVKLIAVSKTKPAIDVIEAVKAGLQHFGENRVQESQEKIPRVLASVDQPLTWHMIGHIQSRKAKDVASLFDVVHSIDSVKLAEKLAKFANESDKTLDVLIEINISGEASKEGFDASQWHLNEQVKNAVIEEIRHISTFAGLRVIGLMTMAPFVDNAEETRPIFAELVALRQMLRETLGLPLPELSMGMTNDYPVAIEEGATMVRIGRAIFGERT